MVLGCSGGQTEAEVPVPDDNYSGTTALEAADTTASPADADATTTEAAATAPAPDETGPSQPEPVLEGDALIERLRSTSLINGDEIHDLLDLEPVDDLAEQAALLVEAGVFLTCNPYEPLYTESYDGTDSLSYPLPVNPLSYELGDAQSEFLFYGQESVLRWHTSLVSDTEVCAARFADKDQVAYELRTFADAETALDEGWTVTHRHHCGTCSSLHNLAVYLATPDLTTPARECARKVAPNAIKECFMNEIGLDEPCAETWTYNSLHTARHCTATCAEYYGIEQLLSGNFDKPNTDEHGNLNPCLACDEYKSGPGFQYTAGRTRRSSGIESAIERAGAEIYAVDHGLYFK